MSVEKSVFDASKGSKFVARVFFTGQGLADPINVLKKWKYAARGGTFSRHFPARTSKKREFTEFTQWSSLN